MSATSKTKSVNLKSNGTVTSPAFSPTDLGFPYWMAGTYWFDIQVPKQGRMAQAVDTNDREASETFRISEVPPQNPPTKTIDEGIAADNMTSRTTISSDTGRGGFIMEFTDQITPNGINYTVSDYMLIDTTNGADVSGEFAINWDQNTNLVTAKRSADKGPMPLNHTYEFSFNVTVNDPTDSKVQDQASRLWNKTTSNTESKEFPTWDINPDKSWIKRATDGSWSAVIDPDKNDETISDDDNTFIDDQSDSTSKQCEDDCMQTILKKLIADWDTLLCLAISLLQQKRRSGPGGSLSINITFIPKQPSK